MDLPARMDVTFERCEGAQIRLGVGLQPRSQCPACRQRLLHQRCGLRRRELWLATQQNIRHGSRYATLPICCVDDNLLAPLERLEKLRSKESEIFAKIAVPNGFP